MTTSHLKSIGFWLLKPQNRSLLVGQCMKRPSYRTFFASSINYCEHSKPNDGNIHFKEVVVRGKKEKAYDKELNIFEEKQEKNRQTFMGALEIYKKRNPRGRGAVEFILVALKNMKSYGVERDLEVYKSLMDILPKGKFIPQNRWQSGFFHYPAQQECLVDVLWQMHYYRVYVDKETGELLKNIIGMDSAPYRKYGRTRYWQSKFRHLSPFEVPVELPKDAHALAVHAIKQITSKDPTTDVKTYDTDEENLDNDTWIVSGMSPKQIELLSKWPAKSTLFVDGGYRQWVRCENPSTTAQVTYFVLKGQTTPASKKPKFAEYDIHDMGGNIKAWTHGKRLEDESYYLPEPTVHEQIDETIFACCATATSSKDSLLSWVRCLEKEVPNIGNLQILFTLKQVWSPIQPISEEDFMMREYKN